MKEVQPPAVELDATPPAKPETPSSSGGLFARVAPTAGSVRRVTLSERDLLGLAFLLTGSNVAARKAIESALGPWPEPATPTDADDGVDVEPDAPATPAPADEEPVELTGDEIVRRVVEECMTWLGSDDDEASQPTAEPLRRRLAVDGGAPGADDDVLDAFRIWRALQAVPPAARIATVLRYHLGLATDDVADVMGCEPPDAWASIQHGFRALREVLDGPT